MRDILNNIFREYNDLEGDYNALQNDYDELNRMYDNLYNDYNELHDDYEILDDLYNDELNKNIRLTRVIANLGQLFHDAIEMLNNLDAENIIMKRDLITANEIINRRRNTIQLQNEEIDRLRNNIIMLIRIFNDVNNRRINIIERLTVENEENKENIEKCYIEINELYKKYHNMFMRLKDNEKILSRVLNENDELRKINKKLINECNGQLKVITILFEEINENVQKHRTYEIINKNVKKQTQININEITKNLIIVFKQYIINKFDPHDNELDDYVDDFKQYLNNLSDNNNNKTYVDDDERPVIDSYSRKYNISFVIDIIKNNNVEDDVAQILLNILLTYNDIDEPSRILISKHLRYYYNNSKVNVNVNVNVNKPIRYTPSEIFNMINEIRSQLNINKKNK